MRMVSIVLPHGEVCDRGNVMSLQFCCWADAAGTVIRLLTSQKQLVLTHLSKSILGDPYAPADRITSFRALTWKRSI